MFIKKVEESEVKTLNVKKRGIGALTLTSTTLCGAIQSSSNIFKFTLLVEKIENTLDQFNKVAIAIIEIITWF